MKRFTCLMAVLLCLLAIAVAPVLVFAADAPTDQVRAIAAAVSAEQPVVTMPQLPDKPSLRDKIGNAATKLKVDGYLFAGKLYAVSSDENDKFSTTKFTTEKGSYLVSAEVGARYNMFRPFLGYETLTHNYDKKTVGLDLFFYDAGNVGAFGVRTAYSESKRIGIDEQKFMYTGLLWKF